MSPGENEQEHTLAGGHGQADATVTWQLAHPSLGQVAEFTDGALPAQAAPLRPLPPCVSSAYPVLTPLMVQQPMMCCDHDRQCCTLFAALPAHANR